MIFFSRRLRRTASTITPSSRRPATTATTRGSAATTTRPKTRTPTTNIRNRTVNIRNRKLARLNLSRTIRTRPSVIWNRRPSFEISEEKWKNFLLPKTFLNQNFSSFIKEIRARALVFRDAGAIEMFIYWCLNETWVVKSFCDKSQVSNKLNKLVLIEMCLNSEYYLKEKIVFTK